MSRLVVFDFDGTMADTFSLYRKAIGEFAAEHNLLHPCVETIKKSYAEPGLVDFGFGAPLHEQRDIMNKSYNWLDKKTMSGHAHMMPPLFDGVAETLHTIHGMGMKLAIVTSRPADSLHYIVRHYGLDKYFSAYRSYNDVAHRGEKEKPHPDQLQSVMKELGGFDAHHTVVIGDTTMDMQMAKNAGTKSIGVTWGSHERDHLIAAGAHKVVENHFSEIIPAKKDLLFKD